jgi:hypothetical protein
VLDSVLPVVHASRDVTTDLERLSEHARWMAYEELPAPQYLLPFPLELERDEVIDFVLVATSLNFAFTDFESGVRFEVEHDGVTYSDSDALHACLARALREGVPVLDGGYLQSVDADALRRIFRGTSELQLLDQRAEILRAVGATLTERYGSRFHNVLAAASPRLYDDGHGLLEVLVRDFPRFDDIAQYNGETVRFYKLAQLALWILHVTLRHRGGFRIDDLDRLTAFADYIVPAALRILGILRYSEELERAINEARLIEAGSPTEVELRAHTIYATSVLCEQINELRPPELRVIVPQVDARLWVPFHRTHWPHHLTRTIFY